MATERRGSASVVSAPLALVSSRSRALAKVTQKDLRLDLRTAFRSRSLTLGRTAFRSSF